MHVICLFGVMNVQWHVHVDGTKFTSSTILLQCTLHAFGRGTCMCISTVPIHSVSQCMHVLVADLHIPLQLYMYALHVQSCVHGFEWLFALNPLCAMHENSCRFLLACTQWTSQNILYCAPQLKSWLSMIAALLSTQTRVQCLVKDGDWDFLVSFTWMFFNRDSKRLVFYILLLWYIKLDTSLSHLSLPCTCAYPMCCVLLITSEFLYSITCRQPLYTKATPSFG